MNDYVAGCRREFWIWLGGRLALDWAVPLRTSEYKRNFLETRDVARGIRERGWTAWFDDYGNANVTTPRALRAVHLLLQRIGAPPTQADKQLSLVYDGTTLNNSRRD